jgi:membrane protease YdiL (CAAX protease family)
VLVQITRAFGFRFADTSPFGPAWVRGSWRDIGIGFAMGILIYMADWVLLRSVPYTPAPMEPTTRMILRHGFPRICAVISCLLFAPVLEEMSFRGVLYAGYRRSFGPLGAAALTTFLFVLMHEPLYRFTSLLQLTVISLSAVWLRLRSKAMGPAVAQHFAFNVCVTGMLIFWPR